MIEHNSNEGLMTRMVHALRIHARSYVLSVAVGIMVALVIVQQVPNTYRIEGALQIQPAASRINSGWDLQSEAQTLISERLIREVVATLLAEGRITLPAESMAVDLLPPREQLVASLVKGLSLSSDPTTGIVDLSLRAQESRQSRMIIDALMQRLVEQAKPSFPAAVAPSRSVVPERQLSYSHAQADALLGKWQKGQERALSLIRKHNAPNPQQEIVANLKLGREYQASLVQLEDKRIELIAEVRTFEEALARPGTQVYAFISNDTIKAISDRLTKLLETKRETDRIFLPTSKEAIKVNKKVEEVRNLLRNEVNGFRGQYQGRVRAIGEKIAVLKRKSTDLDRRNMELKQLQITLESLQRENEQAAKAYERYMDELRSEKHAVLTYTEPEVVAPIQQDFTRISIVDKAVAHALPMIATQKRIVLVGVAVSLLLGLIVVAVQERLVRTFRHEQDVRRVTGLPVLFSLKVGVLSTSRVGVPFRMRRAVALSTLCLISVGVWHVVSDDPDLIQSMVAVNTSSSVPVVESQASYTSRTSEQKDLTKRSAHPSPLPVVEHRLGSVHGERSQHYSERNSTAHVPSDDNTPRPFTTESGTRAYSLAAVITPIPMPQPLKRVVRKSTTARSPDRSTYSIRLMTLTTLSGEMQEHLQGLNHTLGAWSKQYGQSELFALPSPGEEDTVVVYVGTFRSKTLAQTALNDLPHTLKKSGPMLQTIKTITQYHAIEERRV
ncbi:MAG: hypothetical protein HQL50_08015 [Magnetococcales bacterium]|nr:hypothetical protein [Magnetococcales bacterium]